MANGGTDSKPNLASVIVALIGLLTAIVPNFDKIADFWKVRANNDTKIAGEWSGVFREYSKLNQKEQISSAVLNLECHDGNITGTSVSSNGIARRWRIIGQSFTSETRQFLLLNYSSLDSKRASVGSWVLEYMQADDAYEGYHIGFDPEQQKLISYPHVLTRTNPENAEKKHEVFLNSKVTTAPPP